MSDSESLGVTVDQWRACLEEETARIRRGPGGCTVAELAEKFSCSKDTIQRKVKKLIKAGKCKVGKAVRADVTGREQWVPVYRLTKNDEESLSL